MNIVGATSGDTGSAAEYAMRGKRGQVFMLSPYGKMSPFQRAQMYSLQDENIFNIAVTDMFDAAQDIVKAVNNDAEFKARYKIGAVNSINWGRIVAQIVYYFKSTSRWRKYRRPVSYVVPSGNFGNVCAGHMARQMGLPIKRLFVATNEKRRAERVLQDRHLPPAPGNTGKPAVRRWIFPRRRIWSVSCSTWSAATRKTG